MPAENVAITVHAMVETDLRGIDSHGAGMMPSYELWLRQGRITMTPDIRVIKDLPAAALIDAGGGLGHVAAVRATNLAADKAMASGVGLVAVRRSDHFGAAGHYALLAAARGMIGMAMTAGASVFTVPTFGRAPRLSTNPIAFAAPAARNRPFCLDMATSAVAFGKINIARRAGRPIPLGWALDPSGQPTTDAQMAFDAMRLVPLGGDRDHGSHKGYGLALMIRILSTTFSGTPPVGPELTVPGAALPPGRTGHFFLAIDPNLFRDEGGFEADLDDLLDFMRATPPTDPARPVMVAGDPEDAAYGERSRTGIPVSATLFEELRAVARNAKVEFVLEQ
ncbi:MAG: Ldh family oxidoreductase [Alphaproteobacteria bacterium]|nr:Ldh family oxidoreductase [Alphaproteobacteria bacterium]